MTTDIRCMFGWHDWVPWISLVNGDYHSDPDGRACWRCEKVRSDH